MCHPVHMLCYLRFGGFPGLWATTRVTYCPQRVVQCCKPQATQPDYLSRWATLYLRCHTFSHTCECNAKSIEKPVWGIFVHYIICSMHDAKKILTQAQCTSAVATALQWGECVLLTIGKLFLVTLNLSETCTLPMEVCKLVHSFPLGKLVMNENISTTTNSKRD